MTNWCGGLNLLRVPPAFLIKAKLLRLCWIVSLVAMAFWLNYSFWVVGLLLPLWTAWKGLVQVTICFFLTNSMLVLTYGASYSTVNLWPLRRAYFGGILVIWIFFSSLIWTIIFTFLSFSAKAASFSANFSINSMNLVFWSLIPLNLDSIFSLSSLIFYISLCCSI